MRVEAIERINAHDKREVQNLLEWRKRKRKKEVKESFEIILEKERKKA